MNIWIEQWFWLRKATMDDLACPRERSWDFQDLLHRLKTNSVPGTDAAADLQREAADAIRALMATNRSLHRRVQEVEAPYRSGSDQQTALTRR